MSLKTDPEIMRFQRELQHTPAGRSYRRAWAMMVSARRNMEGLKGESHVLNMNRRAYAEAAHEASTALDVLRQLYNWPDPLPSKPPEFIYQPPARAQPQPRKDP